MRKFLGMFLICLWGASGSAAPTCKIFLGPSSLVLKPDELMDARDYGGPRPDFQQWEKVISSGRLVQVSDSMGRLGPRQFFWTLEDLSIPAQIKKYITSLMAFSYRGRDRDQNAHYSGQNLLASEDQFYKTLFHMWRYEDFKKARLLVVNTQEARHFWVTDFKELKDLGLILENFKARGLFVESVIEIESVDSNLSLNRSYVEERVPLPALLRKESRDHVQRQQQKIDQAGFSGALYFYGRAAFHDYEMHTLFTNEIVVSHFPLN